MNKYEFRLLSDAELNMLRGKAIAGHITADEALCILNHLACLESKLDEADDNDTFGTEGWRHFFEIPERS